MVDYQPKTSIRNLTMLLQKVSVLVVDPDPRISNIVKHVLLNLGFGNIHIANTAKSGVDYFLKQPVDFIITDNDMENLEDGRHLVEYIRTAPESPNPYVPIIMLSGHAEQEDVLQARDMGITEFTAKPFTAKTLCDRIIRIIENPRSFIITKRYTGPDRRRKDLPPPSAGERRGDSPAEAPTKEGATAKPSGFFHKLLGK